MTRAPRLLSKEVMDEIRKEHEAFSEWVGLPMTINDFAEYLLYLFKYTRTRKRVYWQFYSVTPKSVKMFDRRKHEKITIKRKGKRLHCMSCKTEKCDHTLFALNDKEVKNSLDIEYIHKISRVFQDVDFVVGDYGAEW